MMDAVRSSRGLNQIRMARTVADHAERLGVERKERARPACSHLGAALADAVLQAGMSYRYVVKPRVRRIIEDYPHTATIEPLIGIIEDDEVANFLLWKGEIKIGRFEVMVMHMRDAGVHDVDSLSTYLQLHSSRDYLMGMSGVGPKTFDYLACLVGIDCIAVDRHVRSFICAAGLELKHYEDVQIVASFAADLLGVKRRDFGAWIWSVYSGTDTEPQLI